MDGWSNVAWGVAGYELGKSAGKNSAAQAAQAQVAARQAATAARQDQLQLQQSDAKA